MIIFLVSFDNYFRNYNSYTLKVFISIRICILLLLPFTTHSNFTRAGEVGGRGVRKPH